MSTIFRGVGGATFAALWLNSSELWIVNWFRTIDKSDSSFRDFHIVNEELDILFLSLSIVMEMFCSTQGR